MLKRKRVLKKSEVLREGFNKGLRDALRVLREATEVDFDDIGDTVSGSSDGGDHEARVVPNKKIRSKMTDSGIQKELYNSKGQPKYPGVDWNPRSEHIDNVKWNSKAPSRGKRTHRETVQLKGGIGKIGPKPSPEAIEEAVEDYYDDDTRAKKVRYWTNRLFRNGNSLAEHAFIQSSHVVADSLNPKNQKKYPNGTATKELVSVIYKPLDKAEVRASGVLPVWDVQKGRPRNIDLKTLIYMNFVDYPADTFVDREGNTFEAVDGSYYWEKVNSTGVDDYEDDLFTQYTYGKKADPEKGIYDPDRVERASYRKFDTNFDDDFTRY